MSVVFIDSNVPMYLVGAPHPHKADARRLLEGLISEGRRLVTSAEVMQEIMRRYVANQRRDAIQPAFMALLGVVDEIYPWIATTWSGLRRFWTACQDCRPGMHSTCPSCAGTRSDGS